MLDNRSFGITLSLKLRLGSSFFLYNIETHTNSLRELFANLRKRKLAKKNIKHSLIYSFALLVLALLSYALTTGRMGFFLDDWYIVWTYRTFGVEKFTEFFAGDRPLFSYIYRFFIPIFKDSHIAWQVFAIFSKWLSALAFWALLRMLFPRKEWFSFAVAALFLVFPGFKFHYFSIMYGQNYAIFAIYFLSYIFMILSIRKPDKKVLFFFLAFICQFIAIVPMELFYGLEFVRPVLIYFALTSEESEIKPRLIKTLKIWLPYLLAVIGLTLFRVLYTRNFSYQVSFFDNLVSSPFSAILSLVTRIIEGLSESLINVWLELGLIFDNLSHSRDTLILIGLILLSFLLTLALFFKLKKSDDMPHSQTKALGMMALGSYAVLVGLIPFMVGELNVNLSFQANRFLLPLSVGSSIALVSFAEFLFANKKARYVFVAIIIAFSVGANVVNGFTFKKAWDEQKDFFTQLTWRAPGIEPGTLLLSTTLPFDLYFSGPSLTAPLNMIYAPELKDNPIPYQILLAATPQMETMPDLVPDRSINKEARVFRFIGNTSDSIVIYMPPEGCLHVIGPETDKKSFEEYRYAWIWERIIPLSNLDLIKTNAISPSLPVQDFGEVSLDQWCYYYQKATLNEQIKDWNNVIHYYELANEKGFAPKDESEWLPLINAHIHLQDYNTAIELSKSINTDKQFTRRGLCTLWQNVYDLNEELKAERDSLIRLWQCDY